MNTGITTPSQDDGFNEELANAFLLLLRDGLSDLMTEWKAEAFDYIRTQEGGLAQYFNSVEFIAAQAISLHSMFDDLHFEDAAPQIYAVPYNGYLAEFGLADDNFIDVPLTVIFY